MLVEGIPLAFNPAQPEAGWVPCASFKGTVRRPLRIAYACDLCKWRRYGLVARGAHVF